MCGVGGAGAPRAAAASIRASGRAAVREAEALGGRVARELIAQGADRILAECGLGD